MLPNGLAVNKYRNGRKQLIFGLFLVTTPCTLLTNQTLHLKPSHMIHHVCLLLLFSWSCASPCTAATTPGFPTTCGSVSAVANGEGKNHVIPSNPSPCATPTLQVPNGGYLCDNLPFVYEMYFTGGGPYTFSYTVDGVPQVPVVANSDTLFWLYNQPYQDSVVITGVFNADGAGTITGMAFIQVVPPLVATAPVIVCDDATQTYTVSTSLSGGFGNYIPTAASTPGFVNGDNYTSQPLPYGQDYQVEISITLGCDTLRLVGSPACALPCSPLGITVPAIFSGCAGQDLPLSATVGAATYQWSGPANFSSALGSPILMAVTPAQAGSYQLIVTDGQSCADTLLTTVVVTAPPVISDLNITDATCASPTGWVTIMATGANPLTYSADGLVFDSSPTLTGLGPGNYLLSVRDGNGCLTEVPASIIVPGVPVIDQLFVYPTSCGLPNGALDIVANGSSLTYSIDGGATFQASQNFADLPPGNYPLVVRATNGCETTAVATVLPSNSVTIAEVEVVAPDCNSALGSLTVVAYGGANLQYNLNSGPWQATGVFTNLAAGTYTIEVSDEDNCQALAFVTMPAYNPPIIEKVAVQPTDCQGTTGSLQVEASGGFGILSYALNGGTPQTNNRFDNLPAATYQLMVADENGCGTSRTVTVGQAVCELYVPNAFSPNNDGRNDVFAVFGLENTSGTLVLYQIFDRWGGQIYEARDLVPGDNTSWWTGQYHGQDAPAGVYVYLLQLQLPNGELLKKTGDVLLLR
jgi:gliding motility-associated-like protein